MRCVTAESGCRNSNRMPAQKKPRAVLRYSLCRKLRDGNLDTLSGFGQDVTTLPVGRPLPARSEMLCEARLVADSERPGLLLDRNQRVGNFCRRRARPG